MASQTEPITIADVPNYVGEVLYYGAKYGRSPLVSMAGLTAGYKVAATHNYPMGNFITGDTPAARAQSEDDSIAAMTNTSYAASQVTNYLQIWRRTYAISYARQALSGVVAGVPVAGEPAAQVGGLPVQRLAHMKQLASDMEYSCLLGAGHAWTNSATAGATRGLVTDLLATGKTDALGVAISKDLVRTELERMAAAGAEFNRMVIAAGAHQVQVLNELYGLAPASEKVGGVNLSTILLPLAGPCGVVFDPILPDNAILFTDMEHFAVVFGMVPGRPPIFVEPPAKVGAGDYEQLFSIFGVDYDHVAFHGLITGLATTSTP